MTYIREWIFFTLTVVFLLVAVVSGIDGGPVYPPLILALLSHIAGLLTNALSDILNVLNAILDYLPEKPGKPRR